MRMRRRVDGVGGPARAGRRRGPRARGRVETHAAGRREGGPGAGGGADVPRVRLRVARGQGPGRARRQADRCQHGVRLPLAAHSPPAAVLRQVPARRDRPRAVPRVQGAQAAGVGRAAGGHRGRCGSAGPPRAEGRAARAVVDPQADRYAHRDPRGGGRGRVHRAQPCAWEADEGAGAQAAADVPRDG
jgi:hypothetical protein